MSTSVISKLFPDCRHFILPTIATLIVLLSVHQFSIPIPFTINSSPLIDQKQKPSQSAIKPGDALELEFDNHFPQWMENQRIQIQTGLYNHTGKDQDENVASLIKELGVNSYIRHVKLDWRPPIWPSAVPAQPASLLSSLNDYLAPMVSTAKTEGIDLIAYYWLPAEGKPASSNSSKALTQTKYPNRGFSYNWNPPPSWFCRNRAGQLIEASHHSSATLRGYHLDLSSEYREFVLTRLKEMADRGIKSVYFDGTQYPNAYKSACFGSSVEKSYLQAGYELPKPNDTSSIDYQNYLVFQARKLAETINYWNTEITRYTNNRDFVIITSGTYLSAYTFKHMDELLAEATDIVKVEFTHGIKPGVDARVFRKNDIVKPRINTRLALGWIIPRDLSGNPVHIWTPRLQSLPELKSFIATSIGYGGIAALHLNHKDIYTQNSSVKKCPTEKCDDAYLNTIRRAVSFGNQISSHIANTTPYANIAIYINREHRKKLTSHKQIWQEQMWPINAAYQTLTDLGHYVKIVSDKALTSKDNQHINLILYPEGSLSNEKLAKFKKLYPSKAFLAIDETLPLSEPGQSNKALKKLQQTLTLTADEVAKYKLVQASHTERKGSSQFVNSQLHRSKVNDSMIVTVTNDYSTVASGDFQQPELVDGYALKIDAKPVRVTDVLNNKILTVKTHGKERAQYIVELPQFQEIAIVKLEY